MRPTLLLLFLLFAQPALKLISCDLPAQTTGGLSGAGSSPPRVLYLWGRILRFEDEEATRELLPLLACRPSSSSPPSSTSPLLRDLPSARRHVAAQSVAVLHGSSFPHEDVRQVGELLRQGEWGSDAEKMVASCLNLFAIAIERGRVSVQNAFEWLHDISKARSLSLHTEIIGGLIKVMGAAVAGGWQTFRELEALCSILSQAPADDEQLEISTRESSLHFRWCSQEEEKEQQEQEKVVLLRAGDAQQARDRWQRKELFVARMEAVRGCVERGWKTVRSCWREFDELRARGLEPNPDVFLALLATSSSASLALSPAAVRRLPPLSPGASGPLDLWRSMVVDCGQAASVCISSLLDASAASLVFGAMELVELEKLVKRMSEEAAALEERGRGKGEGNATSSFSRRRFIAEFNQLSAPPRVRMIRHAIMVGKLAPSMRDVWPIFDLSFPPSAPPLHDLVAQTLCEAMRTLRECVRRGGGSSGDLDRLLSLWHEHGLTASVELYKEAMQVMEGWSARGGASRGEADALLAIMKVAGVRAEQETMRSYLKIVENELMAWRTKQGNEGEKAEAEMRSALAHLDCLLHTVIADDRLLRLLIAFLKRNWEALQQLDPTLSLSLLQLARDSSKLMADPLLRTQARSLLLPASASPPQLRSSPVASAKEAWKSAGKTRGQPEEVREGRTRGDDGPSLQRMSWMLPEEERGREGDQEQEGADNEFKAKLEKLKERFSNGDLDLWQFTEEKEELLFEYGKEFLPKGASERVKSMKIADIKQRIQSKRERSERADQQQQKGWKEEEEEESLKFPTESEWEDHPTAWGRHSSSSGEEEEEGGTGRRREEEAGLSVSHVSSDDKADELVLKESLARCRVCRRRRDYCLCHTAEPSAPSSASSSPSTDSSVETSWEDELSDL